MNENPESSNRVPVAGLAVDAGSASLSLAREQGRKYAADDLATANSTIAMLTKENHKYTRVYQIIERLTQRFGNPIEVHPDKLADALESELAHYSRLDDGMNLITNIATESVGNPGQESNTVELVREMAAQLRSQRAAITEYVAASRVNMPADRVQRAWQTLCALSSPNK